MNIRRKLHFAFLAVAATVWQGCATRPAPVLVNSPGPFQHAAVAADHPIASRAGVEILQRGGNAVDAAVATSFCLSVVRPYSCGIGGGGFMLIFDPNESEPDEAIVLNYREVAPAAVDREHYVKLQDPDASRYGVHASGVPGTVAGLLQALERYGTLDRATVLAPAIRAAEEGFPVDADYIAAVREARSKLSSLSAAEPFASSLKDFPFGEADLRSGDIVTNPAQARALRLIADQGAKAFYRGEIARAIVDMMRMNRGTISGVDLVSYRPQWRTPFRRNFGAYEILAMPPPSSGGLAMVQMFGMLDRRSGDLPRSPDDARYVHLLAEMMKHAFADRAEWLADDAFVDVPIDALLAPQYLDHLAGMLSMSETLPPDAYGSRRGPPDDSGTSHFSVIDANGMAVACTETINLAFGSLVLVPEFGFMLNNQMDDFTTVPGEPNAFGLTQSSRNLPEPGKRPLSSMSPAIVLRDGRAVIVAGASGGPRIITSTIQCMLNVMLFNMSATASVTARRFHHQWMPHRLELESGLDGLASELRAIGHHVEVTDAVGVVQMIVNRGGEIQAASDPRKGGQAAGY